MKKVLLTVCSAFLILIIFHIFFYKSLYQKQITYVTELLDRQVRIVGNSVDNANNNFISDLNEIVFSGDIAQFFSDPEHQRRSRESLRLFYSKYGDFVSGIKLFDSNKNEFTLKKEANEWLEQTFVLHVQEELTTSEKLTYSNRKFEYFLPVYTNDAAIMNIVVSVDYQKYFNEIFSAFNLRDYQWQWVIGEEGNIIYTNNEFRKVLTGLEKITGEIRDGYSGNLIHKAETGSGILQVVSSYYSTQLLQRDIGIVFSSPTNVFQRYIVRNSILSGLGTILILSAVIFVFARNLKLRGEEIRRLKESERMLFRLIEEMPAGVIIYNKSREILKANKIAAGYYSYNDEADMKGKIYPEYSPSDSSSYYSRYPGGNFSPEQFIILKKEIGETVLFRNSIPVSFMGEDATLEMLVDVTMLESARKQEVQSNIAKSEFLARMSYEIRTPMNGIIGMTDILSRQKMPPEMKEIVNLLRRSTEVLLNIVNDILDFSKMEAGKMILDEVPFNLREEIVYCYDLARKIIDEKILKINLEVQETIPDRVIGDPSRLRQILSNLLNHSVSNTSEGVINLICRLKEKNNSRMELEFEISDTGKSFDKASLKKIFGEYVTSDPRSLSGEGQTGFSTILARQLIELMGGSFSAQSPSGISGDKGTRIDFSIVIHADEKPQKSLVVDKVRSFEDIKTLVIAGEQGRDEEILNALHKLGLSVNVTTFQKSTISQIRTNLSFPDDRYRLIVIFDDKDFNGFEPAELLMENKLSDKFVIIMISSNDLRGNYVKSISLGIDHYIVKPFEIRELFETIQRSFPLVDRKIPENNNDSLRNDLRILIIEDNKMNQKVLGTILKSLGYSFDFADDGYSGYIQARTRHYDIVFMDLLMPEMDGYESARRILAFDSSVLIVAFTADNLPESRKKAELSGIKEFISKPVRIEDLKALFARNFKSN